MGGTAVDNKNKIQYKSADHIPLTYKFVKLQKLVIKLSVCKPRLLHSWDSDVALTLPDTKMRIS